MDAEHDADACARKRMSRRHFFGLLGGTAAVLALPATEFGHPLDWIAGSEALLVRAGNRILTPEIITLEVLQIMSRKFSIIEKVHRDYNRHFNNIGDTLKVRSPMRFRSS